MAMISLSKRLMLGQMSRCSALTWLKWLKASFRNS